MEECKKQNASRSGRRQFPKQHPLYAAEFIPSGATLQSFQRADQKKRTRKIIRQSQSRTRICCHKRTVRVPKDAVPRSAKADRQTEYAVRAGESDLG